MDDFGFVPDSPADFGFVPSSDDKDRKELKRGAIALALEAERLKPEQTEERSTFEKGKYALATGVAKGFKDVARGVKEATDIGEMRVTPRMQRRIMERQSFDVTLDTEEAQIGYQKELMELRKKWQQFRTDVAAPVENVREFYGEIADAARTVQEATPGNRLVAEVAEGVGSMAAPALAAPIPGGGLMASAMQSFGAMKEEAEQKYAQMGIAADEADRLSDEVAKAAMASTGVVTALVPRLGGGVLGPGIEGWAKKVLADHVNKSLPAVRVAAYELVKNTAGEFTEEGIDQLVQSAVSMRYHRPEMTWAQALKESLKAAGIGAFGGAVAGTIPASQAFDRARGQAALDRLTAQVKEEQNLAAARPSIEPQPGAGEPTATAGGTVAPETASQNLQATEVEPERQVAPVPAESLAQAQADAEVGFVEEPDPQMLPPEVEAEESAEMPDIEEPTLAEASQDPITPAPEPIRKRAFAEKPEQTIEVADEAARVAAVRKQNIANTQRLAAISTTPVNTDTLKEGKWPNGKKLTPADRKRLRRENAAAEALLAELGVELERNTFVVKSPETAKVKEANELEAARQPVVGDAPAMDDRQRAGAGEQPVPQPTVEGGAGPGREQRAGDSGQAQGGRAQRGRSKGAGGGEPRRAQQRTSDTGPSAGAVASGDVAANPAVEVEDSGAGAQRDADGKRGRDSLSEVDASTLNHVIEAADTIAPSGDKTKARANLAAIKLLKGLEAENRNATPDEKKVLAQYVGWGGLQGVFDTGKAAYRDRPGYYLTEEQRKESENWEKQWRGLYDEVKAALTDDEYAAAAASLLNAHYTSREVIEGMWEAVARLGFKGGRVLEPSAGVGHFFGLMPQNLSVDSKLYGVELDSVTGRIFKKLYPQAQIEVNGFEKVRLPNNAFDLIIGNVPFSAIAPHDPRYPDLSLHNYFFVRGLDLLKPGGMMVAISSMSTMDNSGVGVKARELMLEKADLIAAIRLPNNAFKKNAGTEVTTDILFLRKRDGDANYYAQPWRTVLEGVTHDGKPVPLNEYFLRNPLDMLGRMSIEGTMYRGGEPALIANPGEDLGVVLRDRIEKRFYFKLFGETDAAAAAPDFGATDLQLASGLKEGQLVMSGGAPHFVEGGALVKPEWSNGPQNVKRAGDYVVLRDKAKRLIELQFSPDATDAEIEGERKELDRVYDAYVKRHGALNSARSRFLEDDVEFPLVAALENIETVTVERTIQSGARKGQVRQQKEERYHKAEIFRKRTIFPRQAPTSAETVEDALSISLAYHNRVNVPYMAQLLGKTGEQVRAELLARELVFEDPAGGNLEPPDAYLSGFVKRKLRAAQKFAADNPDYARNVAALEKVIPAPIPIEQIGVRLGSTWVPPEVVTKFISAALDMQARVSFTEATGTWHVAAVRGERGAKNVTTYGIHDFMGHELVELALNLKDPIVYDHLADDKKERNPAKTLEAQQKQAQLEEQFVAFAKSDQESAQKLYEVYNERFNGTVLRKFQGPSWQHYPNAAEEPKPGWKGMRPHQKAVVSRILQQSTLLAHGVGTGKTAVMTTAAMEMKRMGMAKKPVIVVQNATLGQFATFAKALYPGAKILAPSERQRSAPNRQRLMSMIATGDWDMVIVPQSFINLMPDDPKREEAYLLERVKELEGLIIETHASDGKRSPKAKDLEKAKERLEKKLTELKDRKVDNVLTFEQTGIDALFVDEAHAYKKLEFSTQMDNVKGLDRGASQRGLSMLMKVRYVQERNNGKNVVFATGTPISNTIAEAWNMMRYIRPDVLEEYNMESFDQFASTFGDTVTQLEMTAGGTWKTVTRFAKYANGPELIAAFHTVADVVLPEDVNIPGIPALKNGKPTNVVIAQTPKLAEYVKFLREELERFEAMSGREKRDNSHIPLVVFGLAKKASLDMRLVNPSFPDEAGSKLNVAARRVKEIYDASTDVQGTQMVFADSYQSSPGKAQWLDEAKTIKNPSYGKAEFNLYHEMRRKLVAAGIPEREIVIISELSDSQADAAKAKFKRGEIRVLFGSTEKMGVGVDVPDKMVALHHMDAPPRPMDVEQRNGRILRQGNQNPEAEILTYGVENTLDAAMFQKLATKQKFINQILRGDIQGRDFEDAANEISLTFEEQMAAFSGDPLALDKVKLENQIRQLEGLQKGHERQMAQAKDQLRFLTTERLPGIERRIVRERGRAEDLQKRFAGDPVLEMGSKKYTDRKAVVLALDAVLETSKQQVIQAAQENPQPGLTRRKLAVGTLKINGELLSLEVELPTSHETGARNGDPQVLWTMQDGGHGVVTTGEGLLRSVRAQVDWQIKLPEQAMAEIAAEKKNVLELSGFITQPFDKQAELARVKAEYAEVMDKITSKGKEQKEVSDAIDRVNAAMEQPKTLGQISAELDRGPRGGEEAFVNLSVIADLVKVGAAVFKAGYRTFGRWRQAMIRALGKAGQALRNKLLSVWQRVQNVQAAQALGLSPEGVANVNRIEAIGEEVNQTPNIQPVYPAAKVDTFLRKMRRQSQRLLYFGSPQLLRAKQELDLQESYQAAAVKEQSDRLLKMLEESAHAARPTEWKLPKFMRVGAWAKRLRDFKKLALPIAAHLNATGKVNGRFVFSDFRMRSGLMPDKAFRKGGHSIGDVIMVSNPLTGAMEEMTIGPHIDTPDGRKGYQLTREMSAAQQQEIYDHYRNEFPEFMWVVEIYVDPDLRDVRFSTHGVEVPVFNRFALAAKMAERDPHFTALEAYTPDVLVSRSLIGAIKGTLGLRRGTRSPGRRYKTGRAREGGAVRDLFSGFNIRTFQALQEEVRQDFFKAVFNEAVAIPRGGTLPEGYVKLDTGLDELFQAIKRLRHWELPTDPITGDPLFPETEKRMQDFDTPEYKAFIGEAARLRGKQLMLPQALVDMLVRRYAAEKSHGALFKLGAYLVRNSVQLFLVHPKTYVANVLTNDMFSIEAAYRYAISGGLKLVAGPRTLGARDLRLAGNILGGMALNRFKGLRELLHMADQTRYMRVVNDVLPDKIFEDATQLADVKVRYDDKPFDLLRQGEIGAAMLQSIKYGAIDVRAKQRLAYAYLKANAVTAAKGAGLSGRSMRAAVDHYLSNPPIEDRRLAVGAANFELLNYADSPEWLNRFSRNDFGRLVLPFPRFGYHFLAKQAQRLSALKLFLGKVPRGQRANALADLITVATFGLGAGGLALHALVASLFGGDDDEPRRYIGTSATKYVDFDGSIKTRQLDRELVTANRVNLSYFARTLGIDDEDDTDFWLRVRQYPAITMAGAAVLAQSDARRFGVQHGVATYLQSVSDLGSDFFSLGMALRVPDKALAELRGLASGKAEKGWLDPYAARVPFTAYLTEQTVDSFVPGARQFDEVLYWLDPVPRRRTESKDLGFEPGVWEALRTSHAGGVVDRLWHKLGSEETSLPAAGGVETVTADADEDESVVKRFDRMEAKAIMASGRPEAAVTMRPKPTGGFSVGYAVVPERNRKPQPTVSLLTSLGGFNVRPVPRGAYEEELLPPMPRR